MYWRKKLWNKDSKSNNFVKYLLKKMMFGRKNCGTKTQKQRQAKAVV